MVRRLKDEVGDQLPSKVRQAVLMDVAVLEKKRRDMNETRVSQQRSQQTQGKLLPTTIQKDTISSTDRRKDMIQWVIWWFLFGFFHCFFYMAYTVGLGFLILLFIIRKIVLRYC